MGRPLHPDEYSDMNDGTCADLWKKSSEELYNLLYCQRGLAEQYNQEFKVQAFGKRVSSTRQTTNSYRMLLVGCVRLHSDS